VISYGFENDAEGRKREGNKHDLRLLRKQFSNYKNCKYKEVKSPLNTEIPNILGENGIKEIFSPDKGQFFNNVVAKNIFIFLKQNRRQLCFCFLFYPTEMKTEKSSQTQSRKRRSNFSPLSKFGTRSKETNYWKTASKSTSSGYNKFIKYRSTFKTTNISAVQREFNGTPISQL